MLWSLMTPGSLDGAGPLEQYSMAQQVQSAVFDTSFGNLMIVTTALTVVAVVLACFLPSGKPTASGAPAAH